MLKKAKKILALLLIACLLLPSVPVSASTGWHNVPFTGDDTELSLSAGESGQFETPTTYIKDGIAYSVDSVEFYSYSPSVLSVDDSGKFQALSRGSADVAIRLYTNQPLSSSSEDNGSSYYDDTYYNDSSYNDYTYNDYFYYSTYYNSEFNYSDNTDYYNRSLLTEITCEVDVSPDLSKVTLDSASQTQYMPEYSWEYPSFTFHLNSEESLSEYMSGIDVTYESSNPDISVYGRLSDNVITLKAYGIGKTTVTITINNKRFVVHLKTVAINLNQNSLLLSKGQTKQLRMKGISDKVKWSSSNPKIAAVSSSGKVTAKGTGNAVIKAVIGDYAFGCAISVVTPARQKTINYAKKMASTSKYSQPKRMQKGYYDCSSLVWRSYSACSNITFGNRGYAPVAADIGKWCAQNKKLVKGGMSEKNVSSMKLNAGDLMFETGSSNGRYKGIYHVEMIAGYVCYGFDSNGKPVLSLTWANRSDGHYWPAGQLVGRP